MVTEAGINKHRDIVLKYRAKYPYLSFPKLAQIIINEEKLNVKANYLRTLIPHIIYEEPKQEVFADENDIVIPESWYQERPHYVIPNAVRKLLVIGDVHIPFHDVKAVKTALAYGEEKEVDGILLNGDIADMYAFSRFVKQPDLRRPKEEVEAVKTFLIKLRERYPTYKIFYKFGNHEDRLDRYVKERAGELWDLPGFNLKDLLGLDQLSIEYIDERTVMEFGKLSILHGHEIWGGGINVARNFRIKSRVSILFNHFHRYQDDVVPTLDNKHQGGWAVGCLCYSDDTEVLTDTGFKLFKDLTEQDQIANYDKDTYNIFLAKPKAYQKYRYNGKMVSLKSKRYDLLVTPEHRLLYYDHSDNAKITNALNFYSLKGQYKLPMAGLMLNEDGFYTKERALLIGWIISEGTLDFGKGKYPRISIYQKKEEQKQEIRNVLNELQIIYAESIDQRNGVVRFRLNSEFSRSVLGWFDNQNIKRIPRRLLNSSTGILSNCYYSLMRGDGTIHKCSHIFSTKDLMLAQDFAEMVHKLGWSCRIKKTIRDTNYKKQHTQYLCLVRQFNRNYINQKKLVNYDGFVYDVTVDTGYIIIRRNNIIMVSSNCGLRPDYMPVNDWIHGCAIIERDKDGYFTVKNKQIMNGRII